MEFRNLSKTCQIVDDFKSDPGRRPVTRLSIYSRHLAWELKLPLARMAGGFTPVWRELVREWESHSPG